MQEELAALEARLDAVERRLAQTVRVGIVDQVYPQRGTVRVLMPDSQCLESYELPVLTRKTRLDKDWWLPDLGEQVLCLFLPIGLETGFVLGAPWSLSDPPPTPEPDKRQVRFADGAWLEYDRMSGDMQVHCRNKLVIAAGAGVEFRTPAVTMPRPRITGPGEPELRPVEPPEEVPPCR